MALTTTTNKVIHDGNASATQPAVRTAAIASATESHSAPR